MKQTIKRCLAVAIGILLLGFLLYMLWPQNLEKGLSADADLIVTIQVLTDEPITADSEVAMQKYELAADSEAAKAVRAILSRYSYHRMLRSLTEETSLSGNKARYWLLVDDEGGEYELTTGGTGEINMNGHVYRMDYFGNRLALRLMEELRDALEAQAIAEGKES